MYSFDYVIEDISGSGYYTLLLVIVCYVFETLIACITVSPIFVAAYPPSRCRIEPFDNKTIHPNLTNGLITETFIPWNPITKSSDRCSRKVLNCSDIEECLTHNLTEVTTDCNGSFYYDRSNYQETIVTEWTLVCDNYTWVTLSTSLAFLGALIGSILGGFLSDRYGRVLVIRSSTLAIGITGCCLSVSPNMLMYTVLHFLEVLFCFAGGMPAFVYEISPSSRRSAYSCLYHAFFGAGYMVLSLFATYFRSWRQQHFLKTISLSVPVFLVTFLLPKSPRWLFASGKRTEAKQVCALIAKRNNTKLEESIWKEAEKRSLINSEKKKPKKMNTIKESFHRPYTRYLMTANLFVWCFNCLVYYGLALNSGHLAGDPFVNNALSGLMESLASISGIFFIAWLGFVKANVGSLAFSCATCLLSTIAIEVGRGNEVAEKLGTALALLGIFGSSVTFVAIYIQTSELFPTCGRSTAVGLASMSARIGSIVTPWTIQLQYSVPWLTQTIFGIASFCGAWIAATFPETKGHHLTMTYDEAEEFFQTNMRNSFVTKLFTLPKLKDQALNPRQSVDESKETKDSGEELSALAI